MTQQFWTSSNGDQNVKADDVSDATATGQALMKASDAAAAAQVIAPGSTVLSAAATTAIAALDPSTATAEQIVNALQAT